MIVSANRMRSIGWIALLLICFALVMVMAFRVNALRSQVHRAEERIVALRQEKVYLETELETRANQQQLKSWNDVEFGYVAPGADQYLENERQLAMLSQPEDATAPAPIRVASVDDNVVAAAAFPAMVSPLTGRPVGGDAGEAAHVDHATATAELGDNLGKVRHFAEADAKPDKPAKAEKPARLAKAETPSKAGKSDKSGKDDKSGKSARPAPAKSAPAKTASAVEKPHAGSSAKLAASAKSGKSDIRAAAGLSGKARPAAPSPRGSIKIALKDAHKEAKRAK